MRTGGGFQLPGKLISLRHDSFPVESLERRRLLSISRSQKPHTCPCSSATHSRQSRWRSRPGPRPRSRSRSLGPTALSLDLDLGLDLTCPQGLSSSRLKAPVRSHAAQLQATAAKRRNRGSQLSTLNSQLFTEKFLFPSITFSISVIRSTQGTCSRSKRDAAFLPSSPVRMPMNFVPARRLPRTSE